METDTELPRAIDAEKYCIGCLVKFPDSAGDVFERLTATDFADSEHRKIYAAAQRQYAAGGIDPVLLGREVGAAKILVELAINPDNAPITPVHIADEAAKIIAARRKRDWYDHHQTLATHALNGWSDEQLFQANEAFMFDAKREREATAEPDSFTLTDLVLAKGPRAIDVRAA